MGQTPDIDLVAAKRNLCFLLESSRDSLAQFELIKKEPEIVQADPHLAIAVAEGLISKDRFEEAAVVFAGIDQVPSELLAKKLAGISGAIDAVNPATAERLQSHLTAMLGPQCVVWDARGFSPARSVQHVGLRFLSLLLRKRAYSPS